MKSSFVAVVFLVACTVSSTASLLMGPPALAMDQLAAVQELSAFMGLAGPQLYRGKDALGECRLFLYPQANDESQDVWIEGTFQKKDGPVLGLVIPFMLSSSPEKSLLEAFERSEDQLFASAVYDSQTGTAKIGIRLFRDAEGRLSTARYLISSGERVCSHLKRIL